jgi:hypothetical protein
MLQDDDDSDFMFKCVVWVTAQNENDAKNILEHLGNKTVTIDVLPGFNDGETNGEIKV